MTGSPVNAQRQEIGRRIRAARTARGWSQSDLGFGLGMLFPPGSDSARQFIRRVEIGAEDVRLSRLLAICARLELKPDELFSDLPQA